MNIDPFHPRTEQDFLRQQVAALTRERDEILKKLEKIREISQIWNVVDDGAAAKIIALNRIHIIAGGKT